MVGFIDWRRRNCWIDEWIDGWINCGIEIAGYRYIVGEGEIAGYRYIVGEGEIAGYRWMNNE